MNLQGDRRLKKIQRAIELVLRSRLCTSGTCCERARCGCTSRASFVRRHVHPLYWPLVPACPKGRRSKRSYRTVVSGNRVFHCTSCELHTNQPGVLLSHLDGVRASEETHARSVQPKKKHAVELRADFEPVSMLELDETAAVTVVDYAELVAHHYEHDILRPPATSTSRFVFPTPKCSREEHDDFFRETRFFYEDTPLERRRSGLHGLRRNTQATLCVRCHQTFIDVFDFEEHSCYRERLSRKAATEMMASVAQKPTSPVLTRRQAAAKALQQQKAESTESGVGQQQTAKESGVEELALGVPVLIRNESNLPPNLGNGYRRPLFVVDHAAELAGTLTCSACDATFKRLEDLHVHVIVCGLALQQKHQAASTGATPSTRSRKALSADMIVGGQLRRTQSSADLPQRTPRHSYFTRRTDSSTSVSGENSLDAPLLPSGSENCSSMSETSSTASS